MKSFSFQKGAGVILISSFQICLSEWNLYYLKERKDIRKKKTACRSRSFSEILLITLTLLSGDRLKTVFEGRVAIIQWRYVSKLFTLNFVILDHKLKFVL